MIYVKKCPKCSKKFVSNHEKRVDYELKNHTCSIEPATQEPA